MAVPIFVLGLQRSGTTWIANMLAGSGAVAAVAATEHRGVHESIFFSHFSRAFGPFDDQDSRAQFFVAFAESDYFILTGLTREFLFETIANSADHAEVFARVMDEVAVRAECTHWLEKSPHHTLLADELAGRYPDARFVCVTRSSQTLIASRLALDGRAPSYGVKRAADIIRGALVNALYSRHLKHFVERCPKRALLVRYEDLLEDPASGRHRLVEFLGLEVVPDKLASVFAPNTSHNQASTRRLSSFDRALVRLADKVGQFVPIALLFAIERRRRKHRGISWPDWVWLKSGYRPG